MARNTPPVTMASTRRHPAAAGLLAVAVLLSGCLGGLQPPSMLAIGRGHAPSDPATSGRINPEGGTASPTIADLSARQSVLPQGSAYARVAGAVISASPGVEAAELGLARLRSQAAAQNRWPSLSPSLTLDGLAGLAAQLVIDQPLWDNGRRAAERARATAEVDLAAVTLSSRQNERVFTGLSLYLAAEQARVQAGIAQGAAARLDALRQIVSQRVAGGLSDRSEEQIIAQTVAEMQATLATDRQTRAQALADLGALANVQPPEDLIGVTPLSEPPPGEALSVLRAQAEGQRTLAEARIARAAALPGLSATAALTQDRATPGLRLGGAQIGLGSPAALAAADAAPDLVARTTAEAQQSATRRQTELRGRIAQLRTRQAQGAEVLRQTQSNLDLYTEQYRMGRRSLTELTAQTAAAARMERDQAALGFEIARAELELARDAGALVNGGDL